jgi:catechol 2,3-dioxygenase-like lactoylglutathione lyase family enzyme
MMQLKHLNLTTSDVAGLAAFFEGFFGFHRLLERGSGAFTLMSNEDNFVLTLMKAKKSDPAAYPAMFHVGFYVDDVAMLRAKRDEMIAAGFAPDAIQQGSPNGRSTHFYCEAPGGILIEIGARPQIGASA